MGGGATAEAPSEPDSAPTDLDVPAPTEPKIPPLSEPGPAPRTNPRCPANEPENPGFDAPTSRKAMRTDLRPSIAVRPGRIVVRAIRYPRAERIRTIPAPTEPETRRRPNPIVRGTFVPSCCVRRGRPIRPLADRLSDPTNPTCQRAPLIIVNPSLRVLRFRAGGSPTRFRAARSRASLPRSAGEHPSSPLPGAGCPWAGGARLPPGREMPRRSSGSGGSLALRSVGGRGAGGRDASPAYRSRCTPGRPHPMSRSGRVAPLDATMAVHAPRP